MKKLVIVGNGFDKAHGLRTTFDDFIKYSTNYAEKYSDFKNTSNCWYSVEDRFKELVLEKLSEIGTEIQVDEIVEDIIETHGLDEHGEVSYYDYRSEAFKEEIEVVSKIVLLLVSFEADFLQYLRDLYSDDKIVGRFRPMKALMEIFDSASRVVNFNYTNVIELLYNFHRVEHIHGNINDEIVIGCDTFERLDTTAVHTDYPSSNATGRPKDVLIERQKYYEYDMENNLVEKAAIKRFFDDVVRRTQNNEEELYKWLKMKSKDFLELRKSIIEDLSKETFDEVYIIGHSLGQADWGVLNAIKAKKTVCFFHSEEDYNRKLRYIEKNGWNITLKPDTEIFC